MFTHYIITRFNLRRQDWNRAKNNTPVLTDEWLKNRFELFEKFCFPSVQHQINKNFTWLVFFDTETPAAWRNKIEKYKSVFPGFVPLFVDGMPQFYAGIQAEIKKLATPYIITTRIDNDDCISRHFVNEIQSRFQQQPYLAVDFIDGYTLQLQPIVKAGKKRQAYNPFISLIEKNDAPETVWHTEHTAWKKEKNILRITDVRIWLSVIHYENKVNRFVGYGRIDLTTLFKDFIIDEALRDALIATQQIISEFNMAGISNKIRLNWQTLYKDFKKRIGLYK
ncbi:glycosyltransferase [Parafilimonas sp.]|uniref:glycosyltransferase n=1 Tax=Parafilimonas sp. TaxID=1969739 RepID=UPI0039E4656C